MPDSGQAAEPRVQIKLGDTAFTVAAMLHAQDKLPKEVKSTPTIQMSKSRLKLQLMVDFKL